MNSEKLRKPVSPEKTWSGRSENPILVFAEGVKVSRCWLPKLDLIVPKRDTELGLHTRFAPVHMEALNQQRCFL
ncbi:hypothetical protein PGRAN_12554 [Listeria grandensis FSL F6-0971]|uniref:Uncharacterized protein n=1 Tax=Listeria grandensis FSL F6-0971 TaxID=1265819 RepID=W7BH76_9LIST|nr:hypothetical protein PGRAN_12554 [Listeria grandensis FSL F6-0971]